MEIPSTRRGLMFRATTYIRPVYQFFTRVSLLFIGRSVIRHIGATRLDRAYLRFPRNSRRRYSLNNLSTGGSRREKEEEEEENTGARTRVDSAKFRDYSAAISAREAA